MLQILHFWAQHMLPAVQGWGQLANLGVLMVGLLAFNIKGSGPYSHDPIVRTRLCISRHNSCTVMYRGGVSWPTLGC